MELHKWKIEELVFFYAVLLKHLRSTVDLDKALNKAFNLNIQKPNPVLQRLRATGALKAGDVACLEHDSALIERMREKKAEWPKAITALSALSEAITIVIKAKIGSRPVFQPVTGKWKKTPLYWSGKKTDFMPYVSGALQIFKSQGASRLVEPFTGSGAVCLNMDFTKYLLCDINHHLINFLETISSLPEEGLGVYKGTYVDDRRDIDETLDQLSEIDSEDDGEMQEVPSHLLGEFETGIVTTEKGLKDTSGWVREHLESGGVGKQEMMGWIANRSLTHATMTNRINLNPTAPQDPFDESVRFLWLNKFSKDDLTYDPATTHVEGVPKPKFVEGKFPQKQFSELHEKLSREGLAIDFRAQGWKDTFSDVRSGDVVYCDPPYFEIGKTKSSYYTQTGFTDNEQRELAQEAARCAFQRGIPVVISNRSLPRSKELYFEFGAWLFEKTIKAYRGKRTELLAVFDPKNPNYYDPNAIQM